MEIKNLENSIRYHAFFRTHCMVKGLDIREIAGCEGGGFMIERGFIEDVVRMQKKLERAEKIMGTLHANLEQSSEFGETIITKETGEALEKYFSNHVEIPTLSD